MWCTHGMRSMAPGLWMGLALVAAGGGVSPAGAQRIVHRYVAPLPTIAEPAPVVVADTPDNLQLAFTGEMNAKQRYISFAQQAEREGYPAVARLFRACVRAEEAHAVAHTHAIAWTGREARAVLERLVVGSTQDNLQTAIRFESYEVTEFYPALLARARSDHDPHAVRSLTYALSAEREHVALFAAALATLDQRPAPRSICVCTQCGKTAESQGFAKCPNCFASAKRSIREG